MTGRAASASARNALGKTSGNKPSQSQKPPRTSPTLPEPPSTAPLLKNPTWEQVSQLEAQIDQQRAEALRSQDEVRRLLNRIATLERSLKRLGVGTGGDK